jgi:iron-sulfur cluster assembly protein
MESEVLTQTNVRPSPVQLTERAIFEIKKILTAQELPEGYALRVGVKGGGCSGMSYVLGFDKRRDHDTVLDVEGIAVYMDRRHGLYLMDVTVDYHDGLDARGFVFDNPNATSTCGCGSSFAA